MAAKKPTLADVVLSRVKIKNHGSKCWIERLPADARDELEVVRRSFNPAVHTKRAFAIAVIESAKERGWEIAGVQGVVAWLNKRA